MNNADIRMLYDYNYWANARILNAADRVDLEDRLEISTCSPSFAKVAAGS